MSPLLRVNGRHYLDCHEVHCGDFLQWTPEKPPSRWWPDKGAVVWVTVRYELTAGEPVFILPDGSHLLPNNESLFRWL